MPRYHTKHRRMGAGRPKEFDEKEAIRKIAQLFWKKGYTASGTEELLKTMNMGRGSLYHNFGSKENLYKRALDQFVDDVLTQMHAAMQQAENPMDYVREFFLGLAGQSKQAHHMGCFLGNTMSELSNTNPELEAYAANKLKKLEAFFLECARLAKARKLLRQDPALVARHLINLWNGINITRRMYPDKRELLPLINFNLEVIT